MFRTWYWFLVLKTFDVLVRISPDLAERFSVRFGLLSALRRLEWQLRLNARLKPDS